MCIQKYWTLKCGHACFVNSFCPDSPRDEETQIPYLCNKAESYLGSPGSPQGVCRHAMCPHGVSSWCCCACGLWNNERDVCQHPIPPSRVVRIPDVAGQEATDGEVTSRVTAGSGNEDLPGERIIDRCTHERCERCKVGASPTLSDESGTNGAWYGGNVIFDQQPTVFPPRLPSLRSVFPDLTSLGTGIPQLPSSTASVPLPPPDTADPPPRVSPSTGYSTTTDDSSQLPSPATANPQQVHRGGQQANHNSRQANQGGAGGNR